jgi:mycofactocin radical SAM maturase
MKYEWLLEGLTAPICVTWEVTFACNLSCEHCLSASGKRKPDELTYEEAKAMIDDLAAMGVCYINIGGGEPLMRPDFLELVEYAGEKGLPVQFSTNGTLVTEKMAKRIAAIPHVRVQVSIDGATEEVNDSIRGKGSFAGALRAIELLSKENIELSVNMVATRSNFDQIEDLYQIVRGHGAKFRVARLRPSGRGIDSYHYLHLTPEQNIQLYQWVKAHPDVTTGDSYFILSALGEPIPGLNVCGASRATCCITPTGNVYPCAFLINDDCKVGNIREKPLSQMWIDAPLFEKFRTTRVKACLSCPSYNDCGGGCHAVSYHLTGDLFEKDPECLISYRKTKRKEVTV